MIRICNIREVKKDEYDEVWAIVRSLKSKSPWMTHVPELSPSLDLFFMYNRMKNDGHWNKTTFETCYRPRFMQQIANDTAAQAKLEELIAKDAAGKRIALFCFCTDVNLCHRSLISEILRERGVKHTLT